MKRKALWCAAAVGGIVLIVLIWMLDIGSWKKLDMDALTNLSQTTVIYDEDNQAVADLHSGENRTLVDIDTVPEHVKNAFIAIEDTRFYEHCGIDPWRIGGAIVSNIRAGGYREGASTITQQLIKLTHLTSEKTLSRKAQEAWLAIQLERQAEKDDILGMYLNTVYFGKGAYGIEAAAQAYFGKSSAGLTLSEGAMLAGIVKAPGSYAPHINAEQAVQRRNLVLTAMENEGMISREIAEAARREGFELSENTHEPAEGWYVDWVLQEAGDVLGCTAEDVLSGGYHIYTALSADMQREAETLFQDDSLFSQDAEDGTSPEAALIALNPDNGEIMCMVGGRRYETRRGFNRAIQIKRQPGSAFKPISVYAAAVDFLGYTPLSLIDDRARDFGGGYIPSNASGNEYGTVTLRQALARSMNLATVDLITRTGIDVAALYAERAGIELAETDYNLSLALGSLTVGVSPAEMSAAYAPLVNGGRRVRAHGIRRIEDLYGNILYQYTDAGEYVMSEKSARMITDMLRDAVANGTAKALSDVGFPVAAKTGTVGFSSGGNRDAWTVAYTPAVSLVVWQGFDLPDSEHVLPEGTTGGTYPARLAAAFLKASAADCNGGEFAIPTGMTEVLLDTTALETDGIVMLAGERTPEEYLLSEILPDEKIPVLTSNLWDDPKRVEAVYTETDASGYPAVSFIAPDSHAEYRIIRSEAGIKTEVGCIQGTAGMLLSFVDHTADPDKNAEYSIISRHAGFYRLGQIVESEESPAASYRAPGFLERLMSERRAPNVTEQPPLFNQQ